MFLTGEFSKIARVSKRLLQYYDEIGLLIPAHINQQNGYRYYSAKQLSRLNRILALKDLGLTLEQIRRMLDENITDEEIRGMLLMQKTQLEQSLRDDLDRFRRIESRLQQPQAQLPDVVLKEVPGQPFLSLRTHVDSLATAWNLIQQMEQTLPPIIGKQHISNIVTVTHSQMYEETDNDVELGFLLKGDVQSPEMFLDQYPLTVRHLPTVHTMATVIHNSRNVSEAACYGLLGEWIEANPYRIAGPHRELFIEFPFPKSADELVLEIQFPVERIDNDPLPTLLE